MNNFALFVFVPLYAITRCLTVGYHAFPVKINILTLQDRRILTISWNSE